MEATVFTGFTDATLSFLSDLKANNTRDWFAENRKAYEASVKKPAEAFAGLMAGELEALTGKPMKPKIFRINRDVRFSKDKTPYNTHIHIGWSAEGVGAANASFMFGLSTDYCTVGCGAFEFPGPVLEAYRKRVAGPAGVDLGAMIDGLKREGYRLQEPALKRIPAGFPADHPYAELALHKGIALWRDFESPKEATQADIAARSLGHFAALLPLWRFIEDLG